MRTRCRHVITLISCSLLISLETLSAGTETDEFWQFYEKHPHMQDYFPFGVYGGAQGDWTPWGHSSQAYTRILTDTIAENGFNVIWGGKTPHATREVSDGPLISIPFNRWFYGTELPLKEMKIFPTLINYMRFNSGALAKFQREEPALNVQEMAEVEADRKDYLEFAATLAREHPESIIGFVSDDEPLYLAPSIAAIRLIEKYTKLPVTTCQPTWGGFRRFVGHMQPMTADWYPTWDVTRDSWSIAKNLRWLQDHHPDRVFYFIPLAAAWSAHEPTKPWLKDSRPSPTELRMQFWQALAGGTKGFFYFHVGGPVLQPQWAGGQDGLLNGLLWPNNDLWDELGSIARMITVTGPLLISCRPDTSIRPDVSCRRLSYPEFEGQAIDCGLLKCIKHDRQFLIPWNNNSHHQENGSILIPEGRLNGRKIYDLISLREVSLADVDGNKNLNLSLPAGGGHIYLIADPEQFELCRQTILRHKVRLPRIVARMRYRIASTNGLNLKQPQNIDALLKDAKQAESRGNWVQAAKMYQRATTAISRNEEAIPNPVRETKRHLDQIAEVLTNTEDLFRTHVRVLDLPSSQWIYSAHAANPHVGNEIREWASLVNLYLDALIRSREGTYQAALPRAFLDTVLTLQNLVTKNKQSTAAAIKNRLGEIRKPIRLAMITPDRNDVEYHMIQSWLFENISPTWIAPDATGTLTDETGKPVRFADYDAVWIHQLRYARPVASEGHVDPMQILIPELVKKEAVQAMKEYVNDGGCLFLTGISGLYTMVLGVESVMPDRVRENRYLTPILATGLAASDDSGGHPVFSNLSAGGFFTNCNFPGHNLITECAWSEQKPSGKVIANEFVEYKAGDNPSGEPRRMDRYAAMVEYSLGCGTVIVLGGRSCDFTPQNPFPGEHSEQVRQGGRGKMREQMRKFMLNALVHYTSLTEPEQNEKK
ncbi:MAG: hypothetical protein MK110_07525 [Fuerstiella sp.]|nr:hypothetical protein [Fuerstiella sp.]